MTKRLKKTTKKTKQTKQTNDREQPCALAVGKDAIYMHGGLRGQYVRPDKFAITCYNEMWRLSRSSNHKFFTWTQIYPDSTKCDPDNKMAPALRYGHKGWKYQSQIFFFGGTGDHPEKYMNSCAEWFYDQSFFYVEGNEKKVYTSNQLVKYNPLSREWTDEETTGSVSTPRCEFDLMELQGKVYLYG